MNTISPAQPYWFISSWVAVISAMNIRSQEPMSVVSRQSTRFRRMESRAESIEAAHPGDASTSVSTTDSRIWFGRRRASLMMSPPWEVSASMFRAKLYSISVTPQKR